MALKYRTGSGMGCIVLLLANIALLLAAPALAQYNEPVASQSNVFSGDARLFVTSVGDEVVVLDLPLGRTSSVIKVPSPSTAMKLSADHRYIITTRARQYGPEYITVIRTGVVRDVNVTSGEEPTSETPYKIPAGNATLFGRAMVTKMVDVGDSIVASHDDYILYNPSTNSYMMAEEARGVMLMFNASALEATSAFEPTEVSLLTPDHYAVLVWGDELYLGYNHEDKVKRLSLDGTIHEEHNCTGVHGSASYFGSGKTVGAFGCSDGILVVDGKGHSTLLSTETRVGSFIHGHAGNIFGIGRDLATLYHVDLAADSPSVTNVFSGGERVRHVTFDDDNYFAQMHATGNLTIHNASTGSIITHVQVTTATDTTAIPDMAVYKNSYIYVSLAQYGVVAVVHVHLDGNDTHANVIDQIYVGGRPLRLMIAD